MNDILIRNEGNFWLQFDLDHLDHYPLTDWRRICKWIALDINAGAMYYLRSWFPNEIKQAEEIHELAIAQEEASHIRYRYRSTTRRELKDRVTYTRRRLKNLKARYQAFKEITNYTED